MHPKFGDMFYSEYFKSNCVVIRYNSDDDWWFVSERHGIIMKAKAAPQDITWIKK